MGGGKGFPHPEGHDEDQACNVDTDLYIEACEGKGDQDKALVPRRCDMKAGGGGNGNLHTHLHTGSAFTIL